MSIFNDNLRFVCKKMGLSQQKLADMMGIKRGKVAGYFYETQARPDFYKKLGELFQLNVGRFLTIEMTDANYDSFFNKEGQSSPNMVAESAGEYHTKSSLIDLLIQVKKASDKNEIDRLLDEAIQLYGKVLDENSRLKDVNSDLKDQLIELSKKIK